MERFFYLLFNCVIPMPFMFLIGWTITMMCLVTAVWVITGEPLWEEKEQLIKRVAWLSIPGGLWLALQESAKVCF